MAARDPAQSRGRRLGAQARAALASEIRDARLAAGIGQRRVPRAAGISQSVISRIERNARPNLGIDEATVVCAGARAATARQGFSGGLAGP